MKYKQLSQELQAKVDQLEAELAIERNSSDLASFFDHLRDMGAMVTISFTPKAQPKPFKEPMETANQIVERLGLGKDGCMCRFDGYWNGGYVINKQQCPFRSQEVYA